MKINRLPTAESVRVNLISQGAKLHLPGSDGHRCTLFTRRQFVITFSMKEPTTASSDDADGHADDDGDGAGDVAH